MGRRVGRAVLVVVATVLVSAAVTGCKPKGQVIEISAGSSHVCVRYSEGGIQCWGGNSRGQLGVDPAKLASSPTPRVISVGKPAIGISAGNGNTCVLTTGGGATCMGQNNYGAMGDGTTSGIFGPGSPPVQVTGLTGANAISNGGQHVCALISGSITCWGDNQAFQLGDPTTGPPYRTTPWAVPNTAGTVQVVAGNLHTCRRTTAGAIECWGSNVAGQLGIPQLPLARTATPTVVTGLGSGMRWVSAGNSASCAATNGGQVTCWGNNQHGMLGTGTPYPDLARSYEPVFVKGASSVVQVEVGHYHACALRTDGTVRCWGDNEFGQLGDGSYDDAASAVPVVGLADKVVRLAIGSSGDFTCALLANHSVQCWGLNAGGSLGSATLKNSPVPVTVKGL
jgi:alpha-tubulin suppressor-like RCC1 family protein